jgi:hypothetical protein
MPPGSVAGVSTRPLEEYFTEFKEVPALLGRRLQTTVSYLVSSLIQRGVTKAANRVARATAKVKTISDNRQKAFQLLAAIVDRRKKDALINLKIAL